MDSWIKGRRASCCIVRFAFQACTMDTTPEGINEESYAYYFCRAVGVPLVLSAVVGLLWLLSISRITKRQRRHRSVTNCGYLKLNQGVIDSELEDTEKINALVTGGSGMLGREIVRILVENGGYKVCSLDLFIPEEKDRNSKVCSYIQADITNYDDLCIATRGIDVVFHTAAILPTVIGATNDDFEQVIVQGTRNVITACQKCEVKRLIYTSTADVVISSGKTGVKNTNEDHPLPKDPLNAYVSAKGRAETVVLAASGRNGLITSALRPGGILELIVYPKLKHLMYIGDRERMLPLVSCRDLANAHLLLDNILSCTDGTSAAGQAFNLSCSIPEKELDDAIASEKGVGVRNLPMPMFILLTYINVVGHWLTGTPPINSVMTLMALDILKLKFHTYSSTRAQTELGWKPTPWRSVVKEIIKEAHH